MVSKPPSKAQLFVVRLAEADLNLVLRARTKCTPRKRVFKGSIRPNAIGFQPFPSPKRCRCRSISGAWSTRTQAPSALGLPGSRPLFSRSTLPDLLQYCSTSGIGGGSTLPGEGGEGRGSCVAASKRNDRSVAQRFCWNLSACAETLNLCSRPGPVALHRVHLLLPPHGLPGHEGVALGQRLALRDAAQGCGPLRVAHRALFTAIWLLHDSNSIL